MRAAAGRILIREAGEGAMRSMVEGAIDDGSRRSRSVACPSSTAIADLHDVPLPRFAPCYC